VVRRPEKRRSSRASARFSVRFQCLDEGLETVEYSAQAVDISNDGLQMISAKRLNVGSTVLLKLQVSVEISGSPFSCMRTLGRIVHLHGPEDGRICYGVAIGRIASRF